MALCHPSDDSQRLGADYSVVIPDYREIHIPTEKWIHPFLAAASLPTFYSVLHLILYISLCGLPILSKDSVKGRKKRKHIQVFPSFRLMDICKSGIIRKKIPTLYSNHTNTTQTIKLHFLTPVGIHFEVSSSCMKLSLLQTTHPHSHRSDLYRSKPGAPSLNPEEMYLVHGDIHSSALSYLPEPQRPPFYSCLVCGLEGWWFFCWFFFFKATSQTFTFRKG